MLLLVAALILVYDRLRHPRGLQADPAATRFSLPTLALCNASRHPLRSTMTIGLMAANILVFLVSLPYFADERTLMQFFSDSCPDSILNSSRSPTTGISCPRRRIRPRRHSRRSR